MSIKLVPWQEIWSRYFEEWREKLKSLFAEIHPIGSTAVPGLAAKPIVDIMASIASWKYLPSVKKKLESLGFTEEFQCDVNRWALFYHKDPEAHLHVLCQGDPQIERHLRFRNYLRSHPEDRDAYADLKDQLSKIHKNTREYAHAKTAFIQEIDRKALIEYGIHCTIQPILPTHSPKHEIIDVMVVNMALQMTYYARYVPLCMHVMERDVVAVVSQIDSDTFNYIFGARFTKENAKERIQTITSLFQKRPYAWWLGPLDTPPDLSQALQDAGLHFDLPEDGMACAIKGRQYEVSLQVKRVLDQETFKVFDAVHIAGGGSKEAYERVLSKIPVQLYGEGSPIECYLGYAQGVPVVTGMLTLYAGVAGISYVLTHPEHRRKGYALEIIKAMLHRAQLLGFEISVLQANPTACSVYEKLGYRTICKYQEFKELKS